MLGLLTARRPTVAVAGTHGKTTTTSLIAHLLRCGGLDVTAFLGGLGVDASSNLMMGSDQAMMVVEADEYDRSFHELQPEWAVVTSTDPDHLDVYGDAGAVLRSYRQFAQSAARLLVTRSGLDLQPMEGVRHLTYGSIDGIYADQVAVSEGYLWFDYHGKTVIKDIPSMLPGQHNIENALAAITIALECGVSPESIAPAMADFKGIKRRFEYVARGKRRWLVLCTPTVGSWVCSNRISTAGLGTLHRNLPARFRPWMNVGCCQSMPPERIPSTALIVH